MCSCSSFIGRKDFFFYLFRSGLHFCGKNIFFLVTQRAIAKASKKKCKVVNKFTIREEETVEYCVVLYGKKSEKKWRKKLKPRIFAHLLQLCTLVSVNRARGFGAYFQNRHSLRSLPHTQHIFSFLLPDFSQFVTAETTKITSEIVGLDCEIANKRRKVFRFFVGIFTAK